MKIDFALALGVINAVAVILLAVSQRRGEQKARKTQAYEHVYEDACFVLTYPFRRRGQIARDKPYTNVDSELERAVRLYLDAHWMSRVWWDKAFMPARLVTDEEKRAFRERVAEEANAYSRELFQYQIGVSLPERSPAYYLDDDEVSSRLARVLEYVGGHLSLFSPIARKHWESAKFLDPRETKKEYERALRVCPHFFEHNARDFDDPFLDLLEAIRQEYRELIRPRIDVTDWRIVSGVRAAKRKLQSLVWAASHPVATCRVRRRLRRAVCRAGKGK